MIFSIDLGFETMIRFIYTAQESLITDIVDLELLFEVYRLADQVDMYVYRRVPVPVLKWIRRKWLDLLEAVEFWSRINDCERERTRR